MKSLTERLRQTWNPSPELMLEAADEIERLTAENLRLAGEVSNRNSRALAGDTATKQFDAMYEEIERLTAQLTEALEASQHNYGEVCARHAEVERLEAENAANKTTIRELDAELGDAKIAIHAAQSCTTHFSDLLKTYEAENAALKAAATDKNLRPVVRRVLRFHNILYGVIEADVSCAVAAALKGEKL